MADLKDLIERLEQLTGPLTDLGSRYDLLKVGERAGLTDDELAWLDRALAGSLDAAVALVPKDWWLFSLGEIRTEVRYALDRHEPTGFYLVQLQHFEGGRLRVTRAAAPALALCIAALKAREPSNG